MGYDSLLAQKDRALLLLKIGESDVVVIVFIWHIQQKLFIKCLEKPNLSLDCQLATNKILCNLCSLLALLPMTGRARIKDISKTKNSADFLMLSSS